MNKKVVCFGEMLWDILPKEKFAGGAPMNVAIHLRYRGFDPLLISKVGKDAQGVELTEFIRLKGISTIGIQRSDRDKTGVVIANVSDRNEVSYEISEPVAWDFIELEEAALTAAKDCDFIVYGSLAARNAVSRATLYRLLESAQFKVFDVNFRIPHYTRENIHKLLEQADVVKMNQNEMAEIVGWYKAYSSEEEGMQLLRQLFDLTLVIVTRGGKGAAVLGEAGFFEHTGYKVKVEDTIGSGDAFLAIFLSEYFSNAPIEACLEKACKAGALVATKEGATPFVSPDEIDNFG